MVDPGVERLRPKQQEVLGYQGGKMGVSAVPGSGKTFTLSLLAARLVASGLLEGDQEVLVVTLVNSAVDNFAARVADFVQRRGMLPRLGYRVRTLHGLAHDIVRERPDLAGLNNDFQIIDEREADRIRGDAALAWVRTHPGAGDEFLSLDLEGQTWEKVRRDDWRILVQQIASSSIRLAKDMQLSPQDLRELLQNASQTLPLAEMCCDIYGDYQRALTYRGAVDFDDLVLLALRVLQLDQGYLQRLQRQWPFILEDEAQDSSRLQEGILGLLAGPGGNWVRVGDPNQAIYETFTTASPLLLRHFLEQPDVVPRELSNSGRSTQSIIDLANYLVDWTRSQHPVNSVRDALAPSRIEPTPPNDPQPNPPDNPELVHLVGRKLSPAEELRLVVGSLAKWLPDHPDDTVAVLVPRNKRGAAVVAELKKRGIEYVELLRSSESTRQTAGALANVLKCLADPASSRKLAMAYRVWRRQDRDDAEARKRLRRVAKALEGCTHVEDFIWPRTGPDWLDDLDFVDDQLAADQLVQFRQLIRRWQEATLLPVDQLILTVAQDLFQDPADLAIAHKLAGLLGRLSSTHPEWQLPELTQELAVIARNQRRYVGLSDDDTGFEPDRHRGKVVVATFHKAKGLEWDRVHLMSVNNYDFPSALPHDSFVGEKWFARDKLNLEAEALGQLWCLHEGEVYREGVATEDARLEYVAERLRLFYVGITRARKELIVTWNTGRRDQQQSVPLIALQTYWENLQQSGGANSELA